MAMAILLYLFLIGLLTFSKFNNLHWQFLLFFFPKTCIENLKKDDLTCYNQDLKAEEEIICQIENNPDEAQEELKANSSSRIMLKS